MLQAAMSRFVIRLTGSSSSFHRLISYKSQFSTLSSCHVQAQADIYRTVTTFNTQSWLWGSIRQMPTRNLQAVRHYVNQVKYQNFSSMQTRVFHTSPRNNIPPVVWMMIKPLAKMVSMISGRSFRKWWQRLTPEKKEYYKNHVFKKKSTIGVVLGLVGLGSLVHYFTHIQSTPVTHRRRYVALTSQQFLKIAQFECDMQFEMLKNKIVSPSHPVYRKVVEGTQRIVHGNMDLDFLQKQNWTVVVVDSDEANAFVLPTGHIFVNTGLLNVAENDDQLAVVLGHEIAHALLGHGAEQLSFATAVDIVIIVVMAAIWAFMPTDGIAVVTEWFYHKVMQLMLHLPYSRKLELEADEVGLQLTAKACYDIRESTVFWNSMAAHSELTDNVEIPQWLSTHPTNEIRARKLDRLVPKAIQQRESCNCPKLPVRDPRTKIIALQQLIEEKRAQNKIEIRKDDIEPDARPASLKHTSSA